MQNFIEVSEELFRKIIDPKIDKKVKIEEYELYKDIFFKKFNSCLVVRLSWIDKSRFYIKNI